VERRMSGNVVNGCSKVDVSGAVEDTSIDLTLDRHFHENIDNSRGDAVEQQRMAEHLVVQPVLSFQAGTKISSVLWIPSNQDHLVVSFANQSELHIYDMASEISPLYTVHMTWRLAS
jgi:hypothetical protein